MVTVLTSQQVSVPNEDEGQERFLREGWTDGLPIILPTDERVAAMVAGSGLPPDHVVADITPSGGQATVEKLAVNAVMAGCIPIYMPVIIAAVEAMADRAFNLHAVQTTTNPTGPMVLINGPIRKQIGVNCGSNCMGPGARANATIGRAIRLTLLNVGGAIPGEVDKATQGMPGKYSFCFGENEEENPWTPLHVERGFTNEDSVVTVCAPQGSTDISVGPRDSAEILKGLAYSMVSVRLNNFIWGRGNPLLVLNPQTALALHQAGYTKDDLKAKLHQMSRAPRAWVAEGLIRQRYSQEPPPESIPLITRWEDLLIVVAGGPGGLHNSFLPTFADALAVSRKIDGPKN